MWSGEFIFGDLWSAYVGPLAASEAHRHVAVQVTLAHQDAAAVQLDDRVVTGRAIVVGPLVHHRALPSQYPATLIYLEPRTALAMRLLRNIAPQLAAAISLERRAGETPSDWVSRATTALNAKQPPRDGRLESALDHAVSNAAPGAISRAAKSAGLSESRLRAVAKAELGAPISQWLLWRKLTLAGRAITRGETLAAAAAAGGFADQAHLTRTMRRMFGVTPAVARQPLARQADLRPT